MEVTSIVQSSCALESLDLAVRLVINSSVKRVSAVLNTGTSSDETVNVLFEFKRTPEESIIAKKIWKSGLHKPLHTRSIKHSENPL